jgi:hypothetical protein
MPEKSTSDRLNDCERIEGDLQTELVKHAETLRDLVMLFKHLADASANPRDLIFGAIRREESIQAKDRFYALLDEVLARRNQD